MKIRKFVRAFLYRLGLVKYKGHFMDFVEEEDILKVRIDDTMDA